MQHILELWNNIRYNSKIVDFSHNLTPGDPLWPGDPATERSQATSLENHSFAINQWSFGEHSGTHIGSPSHYCYPGQTLDQINLDYFLLPFVIISPAPALHSCGILTPDLIIEHESIAGKIPEHACVLLNTHWAKRWPNQDKVFEVTEAGNLTNPGFSPESVRWLIANRSTRVFGTDAPDIGPGNDADLKTGKTIAEAGALHLENLCNLDKCSIPSGILFIGTPPLEKAHGSPARVLALTAESK